MGQAARGASAAAGPRICALTMVFNESDNLPRWLEYYSAQLGEDHCVVIDHGTDDGSTKRLQDTIGRVRLPRHRPFDDHRRAAFISSVATALLEYFDGVIYTDCDEFIVADPRRYDSLTDLFNSTSSRHLTAIGFDVVHLVETEAPLVSGRGLLEQRKHLHFNQSMCKTLLVRAAIRWHGGFHSSDRPPNFSGLYLFHAKHADVRARLERTAITRNIVMAPRPVTQAPHWRFDDEEILRRGAGVQRLPLLEWTDDVEARVISDLRSRAVRDSVAGTARYIYKGRPPRWLDHALVKVPPEFEACV